MEIEKELRSLLPDMKILVVREVDPSYLFQKLGREGYDLALVKGKEPRIAFLRKEDVIEGILLHNVLVIKPIKNAEEAAEIMRKEREH